MIRQTGIVVHWTHAGYGFISSQGGEFYCHVSQCLNFKAPVIGATVSFEIGPPHKPGMPDQAIRVRLVDNVAGIVALSTPPNEAIAADDKAVQS